MIIGEADPLRAYSQAEDRQLTENPLRLTVAIHSERSSPARSMRACSMACGVTAGAYVVLAGTASTLRSARTGRSTETRSSTSTQPTLTQEPHFWQATRLGQTPNRIAVRGGVQSDQGYYLATLSQRRPKRFEASPEGPERPTQPIQTHSGGPRIVDPTDPKPPSTFPRSRSNRFPSTTR